MYGHLCGSLAPADFLAVYWAADARVLHDRPRYNLGGSMINDLETPKKNIEVWFVYLPHADYPRFLGCVELAVVPDMGTSSSGLDSLMKGVDKLGLGVPVSYYSFRCIEEALRPTQCMGRRISSMQRLLLNEIPLRRRG